VRQTGGNVPLHQKIFPFGPGIEIFPIFLSAPARHGTPQICVPRHGTARHGTAQNLGNFFFGTGTARHTCVCAVPCRKNFDPWLKLPCLT